MRFPSRKPGAFSVILPLLSCCGLAFPAAAAESGSGLRLLQVRPALVRTTVAAQTQRAGEAPATLRVVVQMGSDQQVLMLRVNHSLGAWAARQQPASVAFEGYLPNLTGSWVRVTRTGSRWVGIWFDGVTYHGIDSAGAMADANTVAAAADPVSLVVFRLADALMDGPVLGDDMVRPTLNGETLLDLVNGELQAPATLAVLSPMRRLSVGLIADAELVARDGASVNSNILARLNQVDGIFSSQVGVRIQAGTTTLLESATQPFSGTDAGTLLDQLRDYRFSNFNLTQLGTGLSHLMTGRDLDGQTVGIAFLSDSSGIALCNNRYSASLSEANRSAVYDGLIAAHEIAHVFGAPHDGETDPGGNNACSTTPTGFLMSGTISSSSPNRATFSSCSLDQMAPVIEVAKSRCLMTFDTDLSVAATVDAATVAVGTDTAATLTVRNLGNSEVTDAQLNVTVPAGLTLTAVSATGIGCTLSGAAVSCTPSTLSVNATATVRLTLRGASVGAAVVNTSISSSVSDPAPGNNQAQVSITVNSVVTPPAPPPPPPASSNSGGGRVGLELLCALLLLLVSRLQWRKNASGRPR